MTGLFLTLSG